MPRSKTKPKSVFIVGAGRLPRSKTKPTSVFIVGAGRLGSALYRGLSDAGWNVLGAWTRTEGKRPSRLIRARSGTFPRQMTEADLVLLSVPDRAVAEVANQLAIAGLVRPHQVVAHCAGALDLSPLSPLAEKGAEIGSIHPMVAAAPGNVILAGRTAALDGTRSALRLLQRAARNLGMKPLAVPSHARVHYHAAASLAANGLVSLADLSAELFTSIGVPRKRALEALLPLMESALEGLSRTGLPAALTGPIARGDAAVVEAHLRIIDATTARDAYRALAQRALEIAKAQGRANPKGLDRIARALRSNSTIQP